MDIPDRGKPAAAKIGCRIGAKAQVLLTVPVLQIMPGHMTLPAEIGDLILAVTPLAEDLDGGQVHIRLGIVIGKIGKLLHLVQGCTFLHLQAIAADMLRL